MLLTSRPNAALCRRAAHRREAGTVASPSVVLPQTLRAAPQRRTRRAAPAEVFGLEALGVPAEPNPAVQSAAYATLGLAAASFFGTFVVAPRFKDQFKEPESWPEIYEQLLGMNVQPVEAQQAFEKAKRGAVLVDVRIADKYASGHADGSLSVPLYNAISTWDLPSLIRRAAFAFFGIAGTELNEEFVPQALALVPKGKEVILLCENGGSLVNKSGTRYGFQSRSLKAFYFLRKAGYGKISYVRGGIGEWSRSKLPMAAGVEEEEVVSARR